MRTKTSPTHPYIDCPHSSLTTIPQSIQDDRILDTLPLITKNKSPAPVQPLCSSRNQLSLRPIHLQTMAMLYKRDPTPFPIGMGHCSKTTSPTYTSSGKTPTSVPYQQNTHSYQQVPAPTQKKHSIPAMSKPTPPEAFCRRCNGNRPQGHYPHGSSSSQDVPKLRTECAILGGSVMNPLSPPNSPKNGS